MPGMNTITAPRPPARLPRLHRPTVGRSWCRAYTTSDAAHQYEQGWRNPEDHTPDACGTPAQQGALDRVQEDAS